MSAELLKRNFFEIGIKKKQLPSVAVKLYQLKPSNSADSDLHEDRGGLTDLAKQLH